MQQRIFRAEQGSSFWWGHGAKLLCFMAWMKCGPAKTPRQSSSTVQEAVLVVKPVQDGVHHHAAGPIEVMPLALHLHRAVPARNGKTGS
jgi:hypothetical protein